MPIELQDGLVESPFQQPAAALGSSNLLEIAVIALTAVVAVATLVALSELASRIIRERYGKEQPAFPVLSALYAQRLYGRILYGVPPVAGGLPITVRPPPDHPR